MCGAESAPTPPPPPPLTSRAGGSYRGMPPLASPPMTRATRHQGRRARRWHPMEREEAVEAMLEYENC